MPTLFFKKILGCSRSFASPLDNFVFLPVEEHSCFSALLSMLTSFFVVLVTKCVEIFLYQGIFWHQVDVLQFSPLLTLYREIASDYRGSGLSPTLAPFPLQMPITSPGTDLTSDRLAKTGSHNPLLRFN